MADALLVLNAGSSSVKFSLYAIDAAILVRDVHGQIEGLNEAARFVAREDDGNIVAQHDWSAHALDHAGATAFLLRYIERDLGRHRVVAAGHRVVHGGVRFTRPVVVDENILRELEALIPLAPLHQPHNLAPIRAIAQQAPRLPQVACFDTSFHRTQKPLAQTFAPPFEFHERGFGVTASTACRTSSSQARCRRLTQRPHAAESSWRILATAHRCARSTPASASPRRWALPRSTDS